MVTTIKKLTGGTHPFYEYACLSTDVKPVSLVPENSLCIEIDTGKKFYFSDGAWHEAPSRGGGSGDGGSSLPPMTGKNGKVLGVTLDAQDHEQAEWVTPTGGGAEKFVVTITDNAGVTSNKTVAEILAAKAAGKEVVAHVTSSAYSGQVIELPLMWSFASEEGSAVFFSGSAPRLVPPLTEAVYSVYCLAQTGQEEVWGSDGVELGEGVPSYSSSNNGQVLGVSSGSLAWVDSNAPLIVTMTLDESDPTKLVGNKTTNEIYTAISGGVLVILKGTVVETDFTIGVLGAAESDESGHTTHTVYYPWVDKSIKSSEGNSSGYIEIDLS